jgi:hypothetical protein
MGDSNERARTAQRKTVMSYRRIFVVCTFLALAMSLIPAIVSPRAAEAALLFNKRVAGTYYLVEDGGASFRIMTLTEDQNWFSTSSLQADQISGHLFSDQQGVWRRTGRLEITATVLDFDFDAKGSLNGIARICCVVIFDAHFRKVHGRYSGEIFAPGVNPLDLGDNKPIDRFEATFTGERVGHCSRLRMPL